MSLPNPVIEGYIFQKDGHTELPIRFISKSLHKSQLNWSTIEKELFAIFYTVTKYKFLLRDVKFTIETDHKNLTYLKTAQSAKVRQWQLALQEYDFRTSPLCPPGPHTCLQHTQIPIYPEYILQISRNLGVQDLGIQDLGIQDSRYLASRLLYAYSRSHTYQLFTLAVMLTTRSDDLI